jgi:hypothetical protein
VELALGLVVALEGAAFVALYLLGRSLAGPGRTRWGVGWRLVAALALVALLAAPNHPTLALVAIGVALAGAAPSLGARVSAHPRVRRVTGVVARHWVGALVLPFAALVAIDSLAGGDWTPAEAAVGWVELLVLGYLVGAATIRYGRGRWPIAACVGMGAVTAVFAGVVERPLLPVTSDGLVVGAAMAVLLCLLSLGQGRRARPSATAG